MKIFVTAKQGTKREYIEQGTEDLHLVVTVKERQEGGKANEALARALARRFGVARSRIALIRGLSSRRKVFEIKRG